MFDHRDGSTILFSGVESSHRTNGKWLLKAATIMRVQAIIFDISLFNCTACQYRGQFLCPSSFYKCAKWEKECTSGYPFHKFDRFQWYFEHIFNNLIYTTHFYYCIIGFLYPIRICQPDFDLKILKSRSPYCIGNCIIYYFDPDRKIPKKQSQQKKIKSHQRMMKCEMT